MRVFLSYTPDDVPAGEGDHHGESERDLLAPGTTPRRLPRVVFFQPAPDGDVLGWLPLSRYPLAAPATRGCSLHMSAAKQESTKRKCIKTQPEGLVLTTIRSHGDFHSDLSLGSPTEREREKERVVEGKRNLFFAVLIRKVAAAIRQNRPLAYLSQSPGRSRGLSPPVATRPGAKSHREDQAAMLYLYTAHGK